MARAACTTALYWTMRCVTSVSPADVRFTLEAIRRESKHDSINESLLPHTLLLAYLSRLACPSRFDAGAGSAHMAGSKNISTSNGHYANLQLSILCGLLRCTLCLLLILLFQFFHFVLTVELGNSLPRLDFGHLCLRILWINIRRGPPVPLCISSSSRVVPVCSWLAQKFGLHKRECTCRGDGAYVGCWMRQRRDDVRCAHRQEQHGQKI